MCFLLFMIALNVYLYRRNRVNENTSPYCYHSHDWERDGGKAARKELENCY